MERVFSIESGSSPSSRNLYVGREQLLSADLKVGVIQKILEPGHFIISVESGLEFEARGSVGLKVGSEVQVLVPPNHLKRMQEIPGVDVKSKDDGIQWSAFIPLGFGGKEASAKLQVYIERKTKKPLDKTTPAAYFVFEVETEKIGFIQWSIYLWKRQVSLQVYGQSMKVNQRLSLTSLAEVVEKNLKDRGFVIVAPTVFLTKPFKVPTGFRLNVRG